MPRYVAVMGEMRDVSIGATAQVWLTLAAMIIQGREEMLNLPLIPSMAVLGLMQLRERYRDTHTGEERIA